MSTHRIDGIARTAATRLSRRSSLLTLGGAALAAPLATQRLGEAKKKKGKDCKKKEKQRCNNDAAACLDTLTLACEGDPECVAQFGVCCDACSASGFLACFVAASQP